MLSSRSFTSGVLSDTPAAERARPGGEKFADHELLESLFQDGFPVLLPLNDLINYKPRAKVEWYSRFSFVGLQTLEAYESGQELFNNYGPRDNEALLLGYGFAVENNDFDHYSVGLQIPPGSPPDVARGWQLPPAPCPRPQSDYKYYIYNINHPSAVSALALELSVFSIDLLEAMALLSANDRELQAMYAARRTNIRLAVKTGRPMDRHNLLSMLAQLYTECSQRSKKLLNSQPSTKPTSRKQTYARFYRDTQSEIVEDAALLCMYSLIRASSESTVAETIVQLQTHFGPGFDNRISDLQQLIRKNESQLKSAELLTINGFLTLLSPQQQGAIKACLRILRSGLRPTLSTLLSQSTPRSALSTLLDQPNATASSALHAPLNKILLSVLLPLLQIQWSIAEANPSLPGWLPDRLKHWLHNLSAWYPVNDPAWCAPVEPLSQSAAHFQTLLPSILSATSSMAAHFKQRGIGPIDGDGTTWNSIQCLWWGWNVVSEEYVLVEDEVANVIRQAQSTTASSEDCCNFLLYVPQLD